jgi:hypothetical protein
MGGPGKRRKWPKGTTKILGSVLVQCGRMLECRRLNGQYWENQARLLENSGQGRCTIGMVRVLKKEC